jgi:hypothetical protein
MGNVQRDEMEISGTIDNLSDIASESELWSIKRANLVKLALWKEVNSPYASKYWFTLSTLREEVAGYYAALRWDNQPNESDSVRAADVIANGIAKWWIQWLKDAFEMNVKKLWENLPKNIENTNKQIWELFGVLDKYKWSSTQTPSNTWWWISSQWTSRR